MLQYSDTCASKITCREELGKIRDDHVQYRSMESASSVQNGTHEH